MSDTEPDIEIQPHQDDPVKAPAPNDLPAKDLLDNNQIIKANMDNYALESPTKNPNQPQNPQIAALPSLTTGKVHLHPAQNLDKARLRIAMWTQMAGFFLGGLSLVVYTLATILSVFFGAWVRLIVGFLLLIPLYMFYAYAMRVYINS